jgi:hypothetical protein
MGGALPRWRGDSKELFFVESGKMMAVDVSPNPSFQAGIPRPLFNVAIVTQTLYGNLQVTPDGKRFLTTASPQQTGTENPITVVLNWPALLKK